VTGQGKVTKLLRASGFMLPIPGLLYFLEFLPAEETMADKVLFREMSRVKQCPYPPTPFIKGESHCSGLS